MSEPMKPVIFKAERELIERADRLANTRPEYERSRSRLIRQAIREHLDREEPKAMSDKSETVAA